MINCHKALKQSTKPPNKWKNQTFSRFPFIKNKIRINPIFNTLSGDKNKTKKVRNKNTKNMSKRNHIKVRNKNRPK